MEVYFFLTTIVAEEIAFEIDFFMFLFFKIFTAKIPIKVSLAPVTS